VCKFCFKILSRSEKLGKTQRRNLFAYTVSPYRNRGTLVHASSSLSATAKLLFFDSRKNCRPTQKAAGHKAFSCVMSSKNVATSRVR